MSPQRLRYWNGGHEEIRNFDGSLLSLSEQEWTTAGAFNTGHRHRMAVTFHVPTIIEVAHGLRWLPNDTPCSARVIWACRYDQVQRSQTSSQPASEIEPVQAFW